MAQEDYEQVGRSGTGGGAAARCWGGLERVGRRRGGGRGGRRRRGVHGEIMAAGWLRRLASNSEALNRLSSEALNRLSSEALNLAAASSSLHPPPSTHIQQAPYVLRR